MIRFTVTIYEAAAPSSSLAFMFWGAGLYTARRLAILKAKWSSEVAAPTRGLAECYAACRPGWSPYFFVYSGSVEAEGSVLSADHGR